MISIVMLNNKCMKIIRYLTKNASSKQLVSHMLSVRMFVRPLLKTKQVGRGLVGHGIRYTRIFSWC